MDDKYKLFYKYHFKNNDLLALVENLVSIYAQDGYSWQAPIIRLNLPDDSPLIDFINMVSKYTEME